MKRIMICYAGVLLALSVNEVHAALRGESSLSLSKNSNSQLSRRIDGVSGAFAMGGEITTAPTTMPSLAPSLAPSAMPSLAPSAMPSVMPSLAPTTMPSLAPSTMPSVMPTTMPSAVAATLAPTVVTVAPTIQETVAPTSTPTLKPTLSPTMAPPPTKPPVEASLSNQIKYSHMCPSTEDEGDTTMGQQQQHTPSEYHELQDTVDTQVEFTFVIETQQEVSTEFIVPLEKEILDEVADHILSCDTYMTVDISTRQRQKRRTNYFTDLFPANATKTVQHNIYAVSYPTDQDASHMSTCNPVHPYSQGCFLVMLRMNINSDKSAVSIAKYMALTTVKRAIDESKFMGFDTVDILYMEYIGPEPVHPYWSAARSALFGKDGTRIFAIIGIAALSAMFLCCCYCCCRRCCCKTKKEYDIIEQTPDEKELFMAGGSSDGSGHVREQYRDEPLED